MTQGGPRNRQEKVPKTNESLKVKPRRYKCLGCNNGKVYNGKNVRDCKGCSGQGWIYR